MIKFGIRLPQVNVNYEQVKRVTIACEKLGFDSIWLMDHFFGPTPIRHLPLLECWVTLSALAAETKRIRVGSLVTCNSYRYPSLLAKMLATLDNISNGRVELGIGAGWHETEYRAFGIPFYKPKVRIEALKEAVQLIKKLWTEEESTFTGKYYTLTDAVCNPKPVQKPHPRIWIGGEGEKLLLRVVAEVADGSNFRPCSPEEYARKLGILAEHCKVVGRNMDSLEKSLEIRVFCGDEKEMRKKVLTIKKRHPSKKVREMPFEEYIAPRLVGTPEQCIRKIKEYLNSGVTYFMFVFTDSLNIEAYKFFREKVINKLDVISY